MKIVGRFVRLNIDDHTLSFELRQYAGSKYKFNKTIGKIRVFGLDDLKQGDNYV